jgi:hypothetical protein
MYAVLLVWCYYDCSYIRDKCYHCTPGANKLEVEYLCWNFPATYIDLLISIGI